MHRHFCTRTAARRSSHLQRPLPPACHRLTFSPPPVSSASQVHSFKSPSPRPLCIKAPPPPAPPLLQVSAKAFASLKLASQVISVDLGSASFLSFHSVKSRRWLGHDLQATDLPFLIPVAPPSHLPCMLSSCTFTLRPLDVYPPALRVCLAGGGEGCGVSTAIPSRLSPVAVQGGTHTGRRGGGYRGRSHLVLLQLPSSRSHALQLSSLNPLPASPCLVYFAGISCLHALSHLPLETVPLVGPASHAADPLTSGNPLKCRYPLRWRGGAGVNTDASPRPSPVAVQVPRGDGREAALPIAAPRESIGVGLASQGAGVQVPPQVQPLGLQFVTWPPPVAPPLSRLANAIPSLALSPIIPSLPTDQSACVPCRWRGGAGVNTDASPHSSLVAVQGGRLEGALLHLPRVGRDSPAAAAPAKCSPSRLQLPPPPTAAPDKAALCSPLVNAFSLSHMHSHMHAHIISPSMLHPNQATCSSLAHIVQTPYSRYPPSSGPQVQQRSRAVVQQRSRAAE
ncbi:unnamed protein product [Closterium sp. NIES-65]|nr:unnamed protein product [Closterium sp. NIES-65]